MVFTHSLIFGRFTRQRDTSCWDNQERGRRWKTSSLSLKLSRNFSRDQKELAYRVMELTVSHKETVNKHNLLSRRLDPRCFRKGLLLPLQSEGLAVLGKNHHHIQSRQFDQRMWEGTDLEDLYMQYIWAGCRPQFSSMMAVAYKPEGRSFAGRPRSKPGTPQSAAIRITVWLVKGQTYHKSQRFAQKRSGYKETDIPG